ncbi:MAG: rhomboid family intramembrane serine protease, partial [Verrucomicrobia bacterium]|nr:rhomboid family intramembrane serine protease [Verrucomicrobiota bacterium]
GDYLYAQGIRNQVESDSASGWAVWVHDDDQLDAANGLIHRFRQDPGAAEFKRAAGTTEREQEEEERENREWRSRFFDRRQVFTGPRAVGAGHLTFAIILACVAVALLTNLGSDLNTVAPLLISQTLAPDAGLFPEVRSGQIWRLFTPILIHFGIAHLLFNMLWLFQLGSMIEGLQGRYRLALLIGVIALVSNVAQYVITGNPMFGGMSGVVYGLFGYVWMRSRFDPASGLFIDQRSVLLMMLWFGLCFTGWVGPIANIVHTGGLIVGGLWGWMSALWSRRLS